MEFEFPKSKKKIHILQSRTKEWAEYVVYIATPYRTMIALTEDPVDDIKDIYQVGQLLGNPQVQRRDHGLMVASNHIVVPYEGVGMVKHMRLHQYDYAFKVVDIDEPEQRDGTSWVTRVLSQYAAPMDQSGLVMASSGVIDPNNVSPLHLK